MIIKRRFVVWFVAAVGSSALLAATLVRQQRYAKLHWSTFMVGDPHVGAQLFFEKEGCAHCHSVNGVGGDLAPDLGFSPSQQASLNNVVSAMWNHAPRMWERMRVENVAYPDLDNEEMSHLFAFLYTARYLDESGDADIGQRLFQKKGCGQCHAVRGEGGAIGPDLSSMEGIDTPIRWTQVMWNHVASGEKAVERLHVPWPHFEGHEMNDLLAYVRANCCGQRRETELLPASPERGRELFQSKSCIVCHSVEGKGGRGGPDLGPGQRRSLTIVQLAGLAWNHSPATWRSPDVPSIARPTFQGQEIADLVAFLASLNYFEPPGSPSRGQELFSERGCSYCHGDRAQGTQAGPAVRSRGRSFTAITLATALWQHGANMYRRNRELGRPWPTLSESDVADVVVFLNSRAETSP